MKTVDEFECEITSQESNKAAIFEGLNINDTLQSSFNQGLQCFFNLDISNAIINFESIPESSKEHKMALYWLGQCFLIQNRDEKVIEIYSYIIEKYEDMSAINFFLGLAYSKLKNRNKAIECFERLIQKDIKHTMSYYHLGELYFQSGDLFKAIDIIKYGLTNNPDSKELSKMFDYFTDVSDP